MDSKKIAFISCINDHEQYDEAQYYISQLVIPEGYSIETIAIENAPSMTAGYNKGMKASDAKYKVYLHQDTLIINKNFIQDILKLFAQNASIGMIGVAGCRNIPANGVWWEAPYKVGKVYDCHTGSIALHNYGEIHGDYEMVQGISGLIMITQYDIPWREDIFNGWHYYDLSQSREFALKGYQVVVPNQATPWVIHDCDIIKISAQFEMDQRKFFYIYLKEETPNSNKLDSSNVQEIEKIGVLDINRPSILITNNHLINLGGSEVVTLNLAKTFLQKGYQVSVATFSYGDPIRELFERDKIPVYSLLDDHLKDRRFDVIWGQHFTTLYSAIFFKNIKGDRIIVNSMSPYEPLEAPPVFSHLLSLNVVNSEETKQRLILEGIEEDRIYVMPNPVDNDFIGKFDPNKKPIVKRICVVSNHVPSEVYEAANELKKRGVDVDIFGLNDRPVYVTPQLLKKYDGIITIGKTVQYGMIMGIPVYCYDRFGGPGWINSDNLAKAYCYNFSGRCSNRKVSAREIADEIINGYEKSFKDRDLLYHFAQKNFIMADHIDKILDRISKEHQVDIELIKRNYGMIARHHLLYLGRLGI